jgi:hypothetical protein
MFFVDVSRANKLQSTDDFRNRLGLVGTEIVLVVSSRMLLGQRGILVCIAICASGFETGYTMRGRDIMDITGVAVAVAVTDLCWWSLAASTTDIGRDIRGAIVPSWRVYNRSVAVPMLRGHQGVRNSKRQQSR